MAKWSQQFPGCSGHIHQSLSDGKKNVFHDAEAARPRRHEQGVRELPRRARSTTLMAFAPMFWPTINSYKRLVDGFWAPVKPTWGIDNRTASFRVIPGSPKSTRLETRCPGADVNPYLALAACIAAGMHGIEKGLKLNAPPIEGTNKGGENVPRAPRSLVETTRIFKALGPRARLVRRRVRRPLRGDARVGVPAVAGRGDRLGTEALLRDRLMRSRRPRSPRSSFALGLAGGACAATLRIASGNDPQSFDPHSLALLYQSRVITQVYESLVNRDRGFALEPSLALSWQAVDPRTWRFKLRPNVRFHDGSPFTADDAVFSIERALAKTRSARSSSAASPARARSTTRRSTSCSPRPTRCCPRSSSSSA